MGTLDFRICTKYLICTTYLLIWYWYLRIGYLVGYIHLLISIKKNLKAISQVSLRSFHSAWTTCTFLLNNSRLFLQFFPPESPITDTFILFTVSEVLGAGANNWANNYLGSRDNNNPLSGCYNFQKDDY